MSLEELDEYIQLHNHLPGVPTEQEVLENGVELGEMQSIMMQKIEELTLYVIQLQKENVELREMIENQE